MVEDDQGGMEDELEIMEGDLEMMKDNLEVMEDDLEVMEDDLKNCVVIKLFSTEVNCHSLVGDTYASLVMHMHHLNGFFG